MKLNNIKRLLIALGFTSLVGYTAKAQNGLENVLVEVYYVSDSNDSTVSADNGGGTLPKGSVTYRIYADMLPGYKLQAVYGTEDVNKIPLHELKIQTTTSFYNNEDRGATSPTYTKTQAKNNTVMLDSWLSVGAACTGQFGILKAEDDGASNISNADGALQNNDPKAGIALTSMDGLMAGTPQTVTMVGIDSAVAIFDATAGAGNSFYTSNGSWASLNGSTGPTTDNKVLIGQFTTNGVFSFQLNIQIGTPSGGVENYVAHDPTGNEIKLSSLTYSSVIGIDKAAQHPITAGFKVQPNPASSQTVLQFQQSSADANNYYSLLDNKGDLIIKKQLGNINQGQIETVDLSTLANGIYFIQLIVDGKIQTQKIVKN